MIKSWNKDAERTFYERGILPKKAKWSNINKIAARKLDMLAAASDLTDLRIPPGNRLQASQGDRKGQHSIRINDQWRICFIWKDNAAHDVEISDYH